MTECKHEGCNNKVYAKGECRYHRYKAYKKAYYQKNREKILKKQKARRKMKDE